MTPRTRDPKLLPLTMAQRKQTREERMEELARHQAWLEEQERALARDEQLLQEFLTLDAQMQARAVRVKEEEALLKSESQKVQHDLDEIRGLLYEEAGPAQTGVLSAQPRLLQLLQSILVDTVDIPDTNHNRTVSYENDDAVYLRMTQGDGEREKVVMEQYMPLAFLSNNSRTLAV